MRRILIYPRGFLLNEMCPSRSALDIVAAAAQRTVQPLAT